MENYITKLSDLKKIIKDAEKLGLDDETKIVIRDSDGNDYLIEVLKYNQKTKKIYLEVE